MYNERINKQEKKCMLHNIKKIKGQHSPLTALIWLIIIFTFSLVMAGGRIPKIEPVNATLRPLAPNEVLEILQKFPELVPDALKDDIFNKKNKSLLESYYICKLEVIPLLNRFFPDVDFYKTLEGQFKTTSPHTYLMAVQNSKRYHLPSDFNRLLVDNGIEVNNKNIIELTKTFVIVALGSERVTNRYRGTLIEELLSFPDITFLEGKRIKEGYRPLNIEWDAEIKCRVDGKVQTWKFSQTRETPRKGVWIKIGQLSIVNSFIDNKPIRSYQIKRELKETQKGKID